MNIRRFKKEDAYELANVIAKTLRTSSVVIFIPSLYPYIRSNY